MTVSIEELTMNAWPALRTVVHGGWLLRMAEGYTKRANSVHPYYAGKESNASLQRKIDRSEAIYARAGQDTIFKLTSFAPAGLDLALEERGYVLEDPSRVMMLRDLSAVRLPQEQARDGEFTIERDERLTDKWLETKCGFNDISLSGQRVAASIMNGIAMVTGYFTLSVNGCPAACGLGVIEREYVGLYEIVTAPAFRNQGHAERLIRHILHWAGTSGAACSYLQVARNNVPANRLYAKLHYEERYSYWYRVKKYAR